MMEPQVMETLETVLQIHKQRTRWMEVLVMGVLVAAQMANQMRTGGKKATAQMLLVILTMAVIMNLVQITILHQAMIALVQTKLITINRRI